MKRFGSLRVGQGIALVFPRKQFVLGGGSKSFNQELRDEVGFDSTRPHFPKVVSNDQWDHLYEDHDGLE